MFRSNTCGIFIRILQRYWLFKRTFSLDRLLKRSIPIYNMGKHCSWIPIISCLMLINKLYWRRYISAWRIYCASLSAAKIPSSENGHMECWFLFQ